MELKDRIIHGCGGTVTLNDLGCWIWKKSLKNGYGQFNHYGRILYAHRTSYEVFNGPIPSGSLVCHKCHNRQCVNPSHLYIGDKKTNAQDMLRNGDGANKFGRYDRSVTITDGERVEIIFNQTQFCKDNKLNRGNFNAMVHGKRNSCKGWRVVK